MAEKTAGIGTGMKKLRHWHPVYNISLQNDGELPNTCIWNGRIHKLFSTRLENKAQSPSALIKLASLAHYLHTKFILVMKLRQMLQTS